MFFQDGLIFYDLEWSGSELLQIGAIHKQDEFDRTILTEEDIHPNVTEAIHLENKIVNGIRTVYDTKGGKVLKSCKVAEAMADFLCWIQDIYFKVGQAVLISHGSLDIPMLYQSFCKTNMDTVFLQRVTKFVNFQDYLVKFQPGLPIALSELVKMFCKKKFYRLHTALDDARALLDVFHKVHANRENLFKSNTSLAIISHHKFGFDFHSSLPISIPSINMMRESKILYQVSAALNPKSEPIKIDSAQRILEPMMLCQLFDKVLPPNCFMFTVDGWILNHYFDEEIACQNKTVIDLLCFFGSVYFYIQFLPKKQSTFSKKKISLLEPNSQVVSRGTRVLAKIQLKQTKDPKVMYILPGNDKIGDLDMALNKIKVKSDIP